VVGDEGNETDCVLELAPDVVASVEEGVNSPRYSKGLGTAASSST
jgi:hypothetical protein